MGCLKGEQPLFGEECIRPSFASLDAVAQRRQHALGPNRCFYPGPSRRLGVWPLCSRLRHYRSSCLHLVGPRSSTFLPPVPRRGFALRTSRTASSRFRRGGRPQRFGGQVSPPSAMTLTVQCLGTMKALTPASVHLGQRVSPLTATYLPNVPSPTTRCAQPSLCPPPQRDWFLPGFALIQQARRHTPPKRVRLYYGPSVRLRLLPTPPRSDAVSFGFGAVASPDADSHRADTRHHGRTGSRPAPG